MTAAEPYVFLTFKVTRDGEAGHPMDHILTRIDLTPDGQPTPASLATVTARIRREVSAKAPRLSTLRLDQPGEVPDVHDVVRRDR